MFEWKKKEKWNKLTWEKTWSGSCAELHRKLVAMKTRFGFQAVVNDGDAAILLSATRFLYFNTPSKQFVLSRQEPIRALGNDVTVYYPNDLAVLRGQIKYI